MSEFDNINSKTMKNSSKTKIINVLLADDDSDARFFFSKAIESSTIATELTTIHNGHSLLENLLNADIALPDVIFLDFNMPGKNGLDCMLELKTHSRLSKIPVIIYTTLLHVEVLDVIYGEGAHYYLEKTGLAELKTILNSMLNLMMDEKFERPTREHFIMNNIKNDLVILN